MHFRLRSSPLASCLQDVDTTTLGCYRAKQNVMIGADYFEN